MPDLPWQGKRVEIHLRARRFRCRNRNFRSAGFAAIVDQTWPSSFKSRSADCNQMYGRAGFELLNARVLPWDASSAA
jgi:transposase